MLKDSGISCRIGLNTFIIDAVDFLTQSSMDTKPIIGQHDKEKHLNEKSVSSSCQILKTHLWKKRNISEKSTERLKLLHYFE